jgi:hypothetical protein
MGAISENTAGSDGSHDVRMSLRWVYADEIEHIRDPSNPSLCGLCHKMTSLDS